MLYRKHGTRRVQGSLRALLLLITAFGVALGWVANVRHRTRQQERMEDAIRNSGGIVWHDYEGVSDTPPGPAIVRRILGEHAFAPVTGLTLVSPLSDTFVDACPALKSLEVRNVQDDQNSFRHLVRFTCLESLTLRNSPIGPDVLESLKRLANLQVLILEGSSVTDDNIAAASRLPELRILQLRNGDLCSPPLDKIRKLTRLESLVMCNLSHRTEICLAFLEELLNLNEFILKKVDKVNEHSFDDLTRLKRLELVKIEDVNFLGGELRIPQMPPQFKFLWLVNSHINIESIESLKQCGPPFSIEIHGAHIDDSFAKGLLGLPHLTDLDITDTSITDDGLALLESLHSLSTLRVSVGEGITPVGINTFRRHRPDCWLDVF